MFPEPQAAGDNRAYKQFYRQQLDELMQERNKQRQEDAARSIEEKRNYNDRVQQLQEADRQKDQTYKNYYRMLMQNQEQRGEQYISPFSSRDVMKDQHIKHAVEEQKVRDVQLEQERRRREEAMLMDLKQGLKQQVDIKKLNQQHQRSRHQREVEFYQKAYMSPKRLEELEAIKRRETELKYKEDLDKLRTEKEQYHLQTIREDNKAFYPQPGQSSHNPLYNPVPFNIQNPYILRDMRRSLSGSRASQTPPPPPPQGFGLPQRNGKTATPPSYFAGIGSSQLLG